MKKRTVITIIVAVLAVTAAAMAASLWSASKLETTYSDNFEEAKFIRLQHGSTKEETLNLLGKPLRESISEVPERWLYYCTDSEGAFPSPGKDHRHQGTITLDTPVVTFDSSGKVREIDTAMNSLADFRKVRVGDLKESVERILGEPCVIHPAGNYSTWFYSKAATANANWQRVYIMFSESGRVLKKRSEIIAD